MLLFTVGILLVFTTGSLLGEEQVTPPPYYDLPKRARYIAHTAEWCTVTTISANETMLGQPFATPTSVSDGPVDQSSGIPYFYHAKIGTIYIDILKNSKVTLSFSEAQFGLKQCQVTSGTDPEWPMCARLSLIGNMRILSDPKEVSTAKEAVFSRHPAMASWHSAHTFIFMRLDITRILLLDFFGGWKEVSVKDYFNVKL